MPKPARRVLIELEHLLGDDMRAQSLAIIVLLAVGVLAVPAQSQRQFEAPTQRPDPTAQLQHEISKLEQMVAQLQAQHAQQTQILQTVSSQVSVVDRRLFITCLWLQSTRVRGFANTELSSMAALCSPSTSGTNQNIQNMMGQYQPR